MVHLNTLLEFSRANCTAICAVLVPVNLLLTSQTLIFAGRKRTQTQVQSAALLACIPAVVMILHVCSWLVVGVVMVPTFVLLGLGSTCLGINFWAICHSQSLTGIIRTLFGVFFPGKIGVVRGDVPESIKRLPHELVK